MILRAAAALLALWLAGCATSPDGPAAPQSPDDPRPAAAPPSGLSVEGPAPLRALLDKHLDIARVGALTRGEPIDDTEWQRLIDATPAQARELLQTEGYFAPRVTVTPEGALAERRVKLVLEPGERVRVSRVTIEVEGDLEREAESGDEYAKQALADLRKAWPLGAGKPFRNGDWADAKAAALAKLRAAGYATASWSGTGAEIDTDKREVRLFLVADSGPLFRYGELQVEGLVRHELETVRNLAAFPRGTPVSETLLLDYQDRLQKSGLFDSVTVTLEPDIERSQAARILVRVKEAPLQAWTFGVGVSANTGPRASVEHVYRRVFGEPLTAHNKIVWGGLEQSWTGELSTQAGADLYRSLLGGTIDNLRSDTDIVLSQQLRLGRTQDTQRIERLYFLQAERSQRTTLGDNPEHSSQVGLSINYHGVWRQLDSVVLPTEGFSFSGQSGFGRAHGTDAETGLYTRLYGRLTGYLPIGASWYGQARIELGSVIKKDAVAVPDAELFRAGGDDSVRGYSYRSLAPTAADGTVSGGTDLFTGSVELARPLSASLPSLWGAVFVDAGRAANGWKGLDPALGIGIGLRWRSPVGPLRLDWAWGQEVHRARLHFSVGIAF